MALTYAIGDIHGARQKLRNLIGSCQEHAAGRPMRFVFLGDYIDRGPESADVVSLLIDLCSKMPDRVSALRGNHEATVLAIVDGEIAAAPWLSQGGAATLRSYGIDDAREMPCAHLDWMRSLPLCLDDGRRFFVHAGIAPEQPLDAQHERDLLWIREPFLSDRRDYGRLIVHGHTPLPGNSPDLRGNRLNLDTGAGYGGPLSAAVFAEDQTPPIAFLQAT